MKTGISILMVLTILMLLMIMPMPSIYAYTPNGKITLMTVAESANGTIQHGGTADLYLTIKPGTGRVFIDSFPLSKLDTQITLRFAREIACDFLNIDCSGYDLFYTIQANSAIVGGPSAGAAATVLTVSMLDSQKIAPGVIMTGTINSGYLIGPVAGISAKAIAAQENGFKKVLIPKWDLVNSTALENVTLEVVPVSDLEHALFEFTGKNYSSSHAALSSSDSYDALMKDIIYALCSKYGNQSGDSIIMPNLSVMIHDYDKEFIDPASNASITIITDYDLNDSAVESVNENNGVVDTLTNQSNTDRRVKDYFLLARSAIDNSQYYSAASFCFAGNVRITKELMKDYSNKRLKKEYARLLGEIGAFEEYLDSKSSNLTTITGLETYMIVSERLDESKSILRRQDPENISSDNLAYAIERFETSKAWSKFFDFEGKNFVLDSISLSIACSKKIEEAEERINYLQAYYPKKIDREELSKAYSYQEDRDYALCIFTASKAKADIDVVLSALFVPDSMISSLLQDKLSAAEKTISHQEDNGIFPILGYSYYVYSKTLMLDDAYSALIYAEYALELSNLDMYFPVKKNRLMMPMLSSTAVFILGFSAGILFLLLLAGIIVRIHKRPADDSVVVKIKTKSKR